MPPPQPPQPPPPPPPLTLRAGTSLHSRWPPGGFLGIGDKESFSARIYERTGPDHYDDANCNKIIFAIHAMTFFRALLGNLLT